MHSDPSQGPLLKVLHSSESGGEDVQWTSARVTVTTSREQGHLEEGSRGALSGLAEPLLSQQSGAEDYETTVETDEQK